eukprot:1570036-Ditylum_brightwellii.AAC.1
MFWKQSGEDMSGLRIKQIKNALNNIGVITQVAAAVLVYLEEYYVSEVLMILWMLCWMNAMASVAVAKLLEALTSQPLEDRKM